MVIALAAAWVVTIIGGYALRWTWTGYSGNTLWDWLNMLLGPAVLMAVVVPLLVKWVSGNAAERAAKAHAAPAATPAGDAPVTSLSRRIPECTRSEAGCGSSDRRVPRAGAGQRRE